MPMKVILVHMPWGALERPALGLSLLQAHLQQLAVACEVCYLNMAFADRIGADDCQWITHDLPHIAFAGDWLFTEALYGRDAERDAGFINDILRRDWRLTEAQIVRLLRVRSQIEPFIEAALRSTDWGSADLVGFTSTFEQNIASLAFAQRLKRHYPDLAIAFGGANWEAGMGEELHRAFDFVDYSCSGEADTSFPMLVEALQAPAADRGQQLRLIPGLVFREAGTSVATGPGAPVELMDTLPFPVFDDYFRSREVSVSAREVAPVLLFEGSRGCWWGAKSHCTFCGLNGHSMHYRSKSGPRVLDELRYLIDRWPCPSIEAVDNILDMGYFKTVLPVLEKTDLPGPLFFEIKANLKRHHVAALKRASILRIQPGIESMSDHVLGLMRKGTTALRNVQLLKWCREYGVSVDWNLLYGFPGETDQDYRDIMDLLPKIRHLQLAGACGPIRLDRFCPYFNQPEAFGIVNVRPMPVYRYLYPVDGLRHEHIGYYFHFDYAPGFEPSAVAHEAAALAEALRDAPGQGSLQAVALLDGGLHLRDTRPGARVSALRLSVFERRIVERIDEVVSLRQVMQALASSFRDEQFDEQQVRWFLSDLVDLDMALTDGEHFLGLALMPASIRPSLERASRRVESDNDRRIPIAPIRQPIAAHA